MNKKGDENRSVRATKRRIQNAMLSLLERRDHHDITVRALCEAADINRSTFYLHYQDIYDLLEQMEAQVMEELQSFLSPEAFCQITRDSYPLLEGLFRFLYDRRAVFVVLFGPNGRQEAKRRALDTVVERIVRDLIGALGYPRIRELELSARCVFQGSLGVLEECFLAEEPWPREELVRFFTRVTNVVIREFRAGTLWEAAGP